MRPPTRFEIMRRNRGFGEYMHHKAELLEKIDCAELSVLRTLRSQEEDGDPYAQLHRTPSMVSAPAPATAKPKQADPGFTSSVAKAFIDRLRAPKPPVRGPGQPSDFVRARARAQRPSILRRAWNYAFGLGENA